MPEARHALVVDDNATNRVLARAFLAKLGWQVDEAECGQAALERAAAAAYDLVLLDISMPGLSGEETCAALRARSGGQALRIVAYTAHAFPEERTRILAAGFDHILTKPITKQSLAEAIGAEPT